MQCEFLRLTYIYTNSKKLKGFQFSVTGLLVFSVTGLLVLSQFQKGKLSDFGHFYFNVVCKLKFLKTVLL